MTCCQLVFFALIKGTNDQNPPAFAYVACADACVVSVSQGIQTIRPRTINPGQLAS